MPKMNGLFLRALAATTIAALPLAATARPTISRVQQQTPTICSQGSSDIRLGPALAPFALLAGSTITNAGNTVVMHLPSNLASSGDSAIGVWPGTAVTGFYPPGTDAGGVNAIYASGFNGNRAIPMAAASALGTAYSSVAARQSTTIVSGDLSQATMPGYPMGTLPPGVYKSNSTADITAGNLTLAGNGNKSTSGVFIFQIASAFTTSGNAGLSGNIILTNGASPCNIYWQVGSSATLGGSSFYGNLFAFSSITLNASNFVGRAFALNGAITIPVAGGALIASPGGR
jgi:hypothetical protein